MDVSFLLPLLAMVTLLAGAIFAYISGQKARERLEDPNAPKSTLAKDAPSDGKPVDV